MNIRTIAIVVSLAVLTIVPNLYAAHCSNAGVAGKWAFTTNGTVPGIGPFAAVGSFKQDISGNSAGGETISLNGHVADETLSGSGNVAADCTSTAVYQVYEDGQLVRTSTLKIIYDDNMEHARALFQEVVLPDGTVLPTVLTVDAHRLFVKDPD